MLVNTIKKNQINLLKKKINKNTPVIIVKNFIKPNYCKKIIKYCETIAKNTPHRKLSKNRDFYSLDVLPNNVKTDRIFRKLSWKFKTCNVNLSHITSLILVG